MDGNHSFRALLVEEISPGQYTRALVDRKLDDLPDGEVLVRVQYSSLNYKDALSASGNKGVTRRYPHTPGIDAAGVVEASRSPHFKPGDPVFGAAAGDLGVNTPGGYGQYIRVPAEWLLPLPNGLSLRQSMIYGTAGFTAAMCVERLQQGGILPEKGPILVTGATGGVGTVALGILAREGYTAVAATGKLDQAAVLRSRGAAEVIDRSAVIDDSGRPLLHSRWAGVVDTVGGAYLSSAIRASMSGGVVTACGNAASPELALTVFPFILRGVSLIGIDATRPSQVERAQLWEKLAGDWKLAGLETLAREVPLEDLEEQINRMLSGGQVGRIVVRL